MSDQYPENLTVEIDRDRLRKYYRARALLVLLGFLLVLGAASTIGRVGDRLDKVELKNLTDVILFCVRSFALSIGISTALALLMYFIFCHRSTARRAASLEVSVEGAFLRVRDHELISIDRKLHFRAIVDYATIQGWLMRKCGIHALRMTTTAGGQSSTLTIHGVKDCLRMRDILSDIDRLRENQ